MKRVLAVFSFAAVSAMAADWSGTIIDQNCSAKKAMLGNEACAAKCIKGGSPAVLVSDDGKIYKIADQDKVVAHAGLFRSSGPLPVVAAMAAGDQVFPGRFAGARPRDHMIQSQLAGRQCAMAVLAGVSVAHQNVLARERPGLARNSLVFQEPDHGR